MSAEVEKVSAVGAQFDGAQHAAVSRKFDTVTKKNKDLAILRKISAILQGAVTGDSEPCDFIFKKSPSGLSAYDSVTSCDLRAYVSIDQVNFQ